VEPVDVRQVDGVLQDGVRAAERAGVIVKWHIGTSLKLEEALPGLKEFIRLVWDTGEIHAVVPATLSAVDNEPFYEWLPEDYDGSRSSVHVWRTADGHYRRESRSEANRSLCELPLAPIVSPDFRYDVLTALFEEVEPATEFRTLLAWMTTDALSAALAGCAQPTDKQVGDSSHIGSKEVKRLLSTQTIEDCPRDSARGTVSAFKVPKTETASRLVINGKPFDHLLKSAGITVPPMPKPGLFIREVVDKLLHHKAEVIAMVDARSMFYQFAIPSSLRAYFILNRPAARLSKGRAVRLAVLPMGISFAPAWAQHVSQFLLEVTKKRLPPSIAQWWDAAVWIDNFLFVADGAATLARVRAAFEAVTTEVNLVLKPWEGGGRELEVLGIALNVWDKTARIASKSHEVMEDFHQQLSRKMSVKAFLHFFGHAGYLTYAVARHPLCLIPRVMSQLRRIGREQGSLTEIELSDADIIEARAWIAYLKSVVFVARQARVGQDESGYATDASTTGIGVVGYVTQGFLCAQMKAQLAPTSIHVGEMAAGLIAAHACGAEGAVWTTDNKVAFHALLKGHSGSDAIDEMLRLWIARAPIPRAVRWVPSASQPADGLSRGEPPRVEELQKRSWMSSEPVPIRWTVQSSLLWGPRNRSADATGSDPDPTGQQAGSRPTFC
jgi:hypothetical protein